MLWNAKNGSVRVGDTDMSFVSFGGGEKPFVILPGLSDGLTTVKGKALLLAKPYRRYLDRYTVYMFSRKDAMPDGYSIRDMADDQAQAMETLGLQKAAVMGVSQGGMIAQYLAIDHPELVEKLVIAVSAPCVNDRIRTNVGRWIGLAQRGGHKALMIDTAEKSYSPARLKKLRRLYPLLGAVGKPASYDRFLVNARAILAFDASGELWKIGCPTLVIGGEIDQTVGVQASRALHGGIAGSTLYVYPGLGHALFDEAKDFYRRVFEFLEHDAQSGGQHMRMQFEEAVRTIPPGRYRHFKGGAYEVICIARHSETEAPMVVYRAPYRDGGVWCRPADMWNERITRNGVSYRRFYRLDRIERVEKYERLFDEATASHDPEQLCLLDAYYTSGEWREDFEADERGELPPDLKRGVLSQDALYDLLEDAGEEK